MSYFYSQENCLITECHGIASIYKLFNHISGLILSSAKKLWSGLSIFQNCIDIDSIHLQILKAEKKITKIMWG